MFFKRPVIVLLHDGFGYLSDHRAGLGTRQAVMELDEARKWITVYKKDMREAAYKFYPNEYKRMYGCLMCGERDPDVLVFHHFGWEFTGMDKVDEIANMKPKGVDVSEIDHEISKCGVMCHNCHEIAHKKRLFKYIYEKNQKYGDRKPGSDCEATRSLRELFRRFYDSHIMIPIEIVGSINPDFLERYDKEVQIERERLAELEYRNNRNEMINWETEQYIARTRLKDV